MAFSESRYIGLALVCLLHSWLTGVPIFYYSYMRIAKAYLLLGWVFMPNSSLLLLLFMLKILAALSCWASQTQASQRKHLQLVIREQAKLLTRAQQEQEPREQQEAQREQQEAQGVIITNTTMTLSPVPEQPLASESMWQDNQS